MADVSAIPLSLASWCSFALVFCLCFVFPMQAWPQLQGMQYTTMDCLSRGNISWTQSILSRESVQIWRLLWCQTSCKHAYCTCSSQQCKGSLQVVCSYSPGSLWDCWHLYLVYTVQEHHKKIGRLTFPLGDCSQMVNILLKVVQCADNPLGPVMETLHLTVLYTGWVVGLEVEIAVYCVSFL